jgi:hypothetical protein
MKLPPPVITPAVPSPATSTGTANDGRWPNSKKCSRCKRTLPLGNFCKNKSTPTGLSWNCRECKADYSDQPGAKQSRRDYWIKHRAVAAERCRDYNLRHNYGTNLVEVASMFNKQSGLCAICGATLVLPGPSTKKKPTTAHVDHDHRTGNIRGLLCHYCNLGLGHFKDSAEIMRAAILYVGGRI